MTLKDRDWIAYVGVFAFPEGDAGSRRVLGIARSLAAAGETVVVGSARDNHPVRPLELDGRTIANVLVAGTGEYSSAWPALRKLRYVSWESGTQTVAWLKQQPTLPKAVILYGTAAPFLHRLQRWGTAMRVPVLADVVEWYSPGQMLGGRFGVLYWSTHYALRWMVPRCAGVIGISRLLCNYYSAESTRVTRIPPTLDVLEVPWQPCKPASGKLDLVYAGVPGKKDLLGVVLQGIRATDPHGERVHLRVLGPTPDQVRSAFGTYPEEAVEVMGRRPHAEVGDVLRRSDFSVLLRPDRRYANAGFPTKVVESLSCGTPVLCNLTSDLGEHIRDGETGFVCADCSASAFAQTLKRAMAMGVGDLQRMRGQARAQAEIAFDYRRYTDAVKGLLTDVTA